MFKSMFKSMFKLPMNLQLFAGKTEITLPNGDTVEIDPAELDNTGNNDLELEVDEFEEEDEGVQHDTHDETNEDEDKQEEQQEEVTPDNQQKEKEPQVNAIIAERKKWQSRLQEANKRAAIADKLMKLVGVDKPEDLLARLDAAEAQRIAQASGITPEQAQLQIQQRRELEDMKREIQRQKYESEVQRLKADPFFADIEEYREEFQEIAERTGMTLEEVYMSKRGRQRMKEMEREIEQRVKANQEKRQKAKVDTTVNGEKIKTPKIDLPSHQMEAARQAVNMGIFKDLAEAATYYKKYGKSK